MKLSKTAALFLYKVLYHYSATYRSLSSDDLETLDHLTSEIEYFLMNPSEEDHQDSDDFEDDSEEEDCESDDDDEEEEDVDDDEEENDEVIDSTATVPVDVLIDLPPLRVSASGHKYTLEFESVGKDSEIDVILDEGSVIIESVTHVKVEDNALSFYTDNGWEKYDVKRLPKLWMKHLKADNVYSIASSDEET
jgi:hypothetical protein